MFLRVRGAHGFGGAGLLRHLRGLLLPGLEVGTHVLLDHEAVRVREPVEVDVVVRDDQAESVFEASITMWVTPRKDASWGQV